jgi:hypothetical protein
MSARSIAEALGNAQPDRGGWKSLCPIHDDHEPSLSLRDEGGKILVHCHVCGKDDAGLPRGTGSSNPPPSRGESAANLIFGQNRPARIAPNQSVFSGMLYDRPCLMRSKRLALPDRLGVAAVNPVAETPAER